MSCRSKAQRGGGDKATLYPVLPSSGGTQGMGYSWSALALSVVLRALGGGAVWVAAVGTVVAVLLLWDGFPRWWDRLVRNPERVKAP